MDRNLFALSLGLGGLILLPALSRAAPAQCAARDTVAAQISRQFGEEARSIRLGQDDTVMERYASAQNGTWTLTVTLPNGLTCLAAAGANFETLAPTLQAKGDPA